MAPDWKANPDLMRRALEWCQGAPSDEWGPRWILVEKNMPKFDGSRSSVWTYMTMVAKCREIDEGRKASKRPKVSQWTDGHDIAAPRPREAPTVPPRERLHDVLDLAALGVCYREIAVSLGLPMGTVKSKMHRQRRKLAERYRNAA